jgi:hypothetical protein
MSEPEETTHADDEDDERSILDTIVESLHQADEEDDADLAEVVGADEESGGSSPG